MKFSFKAKLVSKIPEVERNLRRQVQEAVHKEAEAVAATARQLAPVRTGALRDSIAVKINTRRNAEVGASESYAKFVEFGTSRQAAQPFLRPAAEQGKKNLEKRLRRMKVL